MNGSLDMPSTYTQTFCGIRTVYYPYYYYNPDESHTNLKMWPPQNSQLQLLSCEKTRPCFRVFLEGSHQLPAPPTWLNYPMWEGGESLLSLSDCSPPEPFAYLSPDDDSARHHTGSITRDIFSHTPVLWWRHVLEMTLGLCFWATREDDGMRRRLRAHVTDSRSIWPLFFFPFSSLISRLMVNCLSAVPFFLCSVSFFGADWCSRSRLPWQQQGQLVGSLRVMV